MKHLGLLAFSVLTVCLVGIAFGWIVHAGTVYAASGTQLVLSIAGSSEKDPIPVGHSTQPVVFVVIGMVCILFGIIAVSPLLIDDPAHGRAAGIYLGDTGFPHVLGEKVGLSEQVDALPRRLSGVQPPHMAIARPLATAARDPLHPQYLKKLGLWNEHRRSQRVIGRNVHEHFSNHS